MERPASIALMVQRRATMAANSKAPVVSAPPTATFGGKIGATAPQTPQETNIQTVNPANKKPAWGFKSRPLW